MFAATEVQHGSGRCPTIVETGVDTRNDWVALLYN
jgi:hypothetical protein